MSTGTLGPGFLHRLCAYVATPNSNERRRCGLAGRGCGMALEKTSPSETNDSPSIAISTATRYIIGNVLFLSIAFAPRSMLYCRKAD